MRRKKRNMYAKNVRGGKSGNGKTGGWKRLLAMSIAAVTLLTGADLSGLELAFAEEKSGYTIDVSYTEGNTQATLTGNTQNLADGVTLTSVTDPDGNQYTNPAELTYPVMENGDYVFTVYYQVSQLSGQVDREEKLTVTVDGIASADGAVQSEVSSPPERMALPDLLAQAETTSTELTKEITVVTKESRQELGKIIYGGGDFKNVLTKPLSEMLPDSPDVAKFRMRYFESAYFLLGEGSVEYPISGLYSYQVSGKNVWYYTMEEKDGGSGNTGIPANVAVLLPEDAKIYASYGISTSNKTEHNITTAYEPSGDDTTWKVTVGDASLDKTPGQAYENELIVFSFTIPVAYSTARVEVRNSATGEVNTSFALQDLTKVGNGETYTGMFYMPDYEVKLTFIGTAYADSTKLWAGFVYPRINTENAITNRGQGSKKEGDIFRVYTKLNADSDGNLSTGVNEMKTVYREDAGRISPSMASVSRVDWQGSYMQRLTPDNATGPSNPKNTDKNNYTLNATVYDRAGNLVSDYKTANGTTYPLQANAASYKPGQKQTFQIEYEAARLGYDGQRGYSYLPVSLDLYTYLNANYGTNPTNSGVTRETFGLPMSKGVSMTYETESGAKITIKMEDTGTRQKPDASRPAGRLPAIQGEYQNRVARADSDFGTRNMGVTYKGWDSVLGRANWTYNGFPKDMYFLSDWETVSTTTGIAVPYYKYSVTVEGMRYGYLFSLIDEAVDRDMISFVRMQGVEEGISTGGVTDMTKSTYESENDVHQPLQTTTLLTGDKTTTDFSVYPYGKAWEVYVKPQMGYSRSRIILERVLGSADGFNMYGEEITDEHGRFKHYIRAAKEQDGKYFPVEVQCEPITFNIQYGDGKTVTSLQPSTEKYYVTGLPDNILGSDEVLTGYKVKITNNFDKFKHWDTNSNSMVVGKAVTDTVKAKDSSGEYTTEELIIQPQDLLDLEEVYNYMLWKQQTLPNFLCQDIDKQDINSGYEDGIEHEYTLELIPVISKYSGQAGYISEEYKVRRQTEDFSTYAGDGTDMADNMYSSNNGFIVDGRSVLAYSGSTFHLGIQDVVDGSSLQTVTNKNAHWVPSEKSKTSAVAGSNDTIDVTYLLGVQLQFTGLQNGASGVVDGGNGTWSAADEKWYVSMAGHDASSIDLNAFGPGSAPEGKVFAGWKITNTDGSKVNGANYNGGQPVNGTLDLYDLGKSDVELWKQIFLTDGVLKLEAQWRSSTFPIKRPDPYSTQMVKFYQSPHSFTAGFVMDGNVNSDSTARFLAYRSETGGTSWGLLAGGTINLSAGTVKKVIGNSHFGQFINANLDVEVSYNAATDQTSITFKADGFEEGGPGRIYRIYMWNEANGSFDPFISSGGAVNSLYTKYGINNSNLIDNAPFGSFPYVDTQTYLVPEVYTYGTSDTTNKDENQLFYEGDSLNITSSFSLEAPSGNKMGPETISTILSNKDLAGDLKIALYKKNPGEQTYQMFALAQSDGSGSLNMKHNSSSITEVKTSTSGDRNFTVTFVKSNATHQWDDGAEYRVYAWTDTNDTSSLPGRFGEGADNITINGSEMTGINTIPSVATTTSGILGTAATTVIRYPSKITMSDSADGYIYSGNEEISIEAPSTTELPSPDAGVDVTIQELTNAGTFSISRNSGSEIIALQAFIGTRTSSGDDISTRSGKVGTMMFSTSAAPEQNVLRLYFKSANKVTGFTDGDPFTGQITFRFSKATSN